MIIIMIIIIILIISNESNIDYYNDNNDNNNNQSPTVEPTTEITLTPSNDKLLTSAIQCSQVLKIIFIFITVLYNFNRLLIILILLSSIQIRSVIQMQSKLLH